MSGPDGNLARLVDVELDESIGRSTPDVEHERAVAIFDLIEENSFSPVGDDSGGPYRLKLSLAESRLVFAVSREDGAAVVTHILSLTPFRRIVKDYYLICESYYDAIRASTTAALRAAGYRVVRGGGEHYRTIEALEFSIDPNRRLIPKLDALRRKCNTCAYNDYGLVAQGEADLAGELAAEVRAAVEAWIRMVHPGNIA